MKVKICGVTQYDNALMVAKAGADMIGLNFYRQSPRYIDPADAGQLTDRLRQTLGDSCPTIVGVFVNAPFSHISQTMEVAGLDFAQLSGDESDELLHELQGLGYKAIRPPNEALAVDDANYYSKEFIKDERIPSLLLDAYHPKAYGGTGEQTSVAIAQAVKRIAPRLMLAGGLKPDNVAERVRQIMPWGVDVASGVEASQPGIKATEKVNTFIQAAKTAL